VFLPFIQIQRAVRDERWKLICYPKISHLQLFDLQTDPDERTNLIARVDCAKHVGRLQELMRQWQVRTGDTSSAHRQQPPEPVDLTGQKRVPDQWQPEWIVRKYFDTPQATTPRPGSRARRLRTGRAGIRNAGDRGVRHPHRQPRPDRGALPRIHLHTPVQLPHQEITELDVEGNPERLADAWGCPVLLYRQPELAPGASLAGRWTAWATIRRFRWIGRRTHPDGATLSPEQQAIHLRDGKDLALEDPIVAAAAAEAARGKQGAVGILDGAFGLVMERLTYDRDGKWQPARRCWQAAREAAANTPTVFIALCAKTASPPVTVGGIVGRTGVPLHLDKIFHRFPQAYLPGRGWVDFDRPERACPEQAPLLRADSRPHAPHQRGRRRRGIADRLGLPGETRLGRCKVKASSLRQAWWFPPPTQETRAASGPVPTPARGGNRR